MKDWALIILMTLATSVTCNPAAATNFDDGLLMTITKRCDLALIEYSEHINMCQFHEVCLDENSNDYKRIDVIQRWILTNCKVRVI